MKLRKGLYIALAGLVNLAGCCGVKFERAENEYLRRREIEETHDYFSDSYFSERAPVFTLFRFSFGFDNKKSDALEDYDIFSRELERR